MTVLDDREFPPLPSRWKLTTIAESKKKTTGTDELNHQKIATIIDLPTELILHILSFVLIYQNGCWRYQRLRLLARTCKRFCNLVTPEVYSVFEPAYCEPYLFLRTIISNPRLAELVHEVRSSHFGRPSSYQFDPSKRYRPSAQDKRLIKEGLKLADLPDWKRWATECNAESADLGSITAVIFMLAKNASKFVTDGIKDVSRHNHGPSSWLWFATKMTLEPHLKQGAFANLREIHISVQDENSSVKQLACLFRISKLRKLYLSNLFDDGGDEEGIIEGLTRLIPPKSNDLEIICLYLCFIRIDLLGVIVRSARALQEFRNDITMFDRQVRLDEESHLKDVMTSTKFADILLCQRDSLTAVIIYMEWWEENLLRESLHFHDGLRTFHAITHIECPMRMFVSDKTLPTRSLAELLPPNIHFLRVAFFDYTRDTHRVAALRDLATTYKDHTPHLRHIVFDMKASKCDTYSYDHESIKKAFEGTDVEFEIMSDGVEELEEWNQSSDEDRFVATVERPESPVSSSSGEVSLYSHNGED